MSEQKLYISVENTASAEIVEKKSRFIANVSHAETESEAVSFIEKIKMTANLQKLRDSPYWK